MTDEKCQECFFSKDKAATSRPKIPNWFREEECLWCKNKTEVDSVKVFEETDEIVLSYRCENGQCTYPLSGLYEFGLRFKGKIFVKQYKEYDSVCRNSVKK